MYEHVIAWAGLGLLFLLCLPLPRVQQLLLAVYGLGLRLGMLALVVAAGYLWFRPTHLPTEVSEGARNSPLLTSLLPEADTPMFAVCAVSLIATAVLPLIAVIAVCRRTAGRHEPVERSEPVRVRTAPVVSDERPPPAPFAQEMSPPRFGRRAAADVMARAGSTR